MTKYEKIINATMCICSDIDCDYNMDVCPYYMEEDYCAAIKVRETVDYIKAQHFAWNELKEQITDMMRVCDQEDMVKKYQFLLNYMDVQEEHIEEGVCI